MLQKKLAKRLKARYDTKMDGNSDVVIAVWNGKKSGTGNTVDYALKNGKKVIIIDPNTLK